MNQPRKPLVVTPQFFGCLVFDRRTSRYMPFDNEATDFLLRLITEPFPNVIADQPDNDSRQALAGFYENFYAEGFFDINGRLDAVALEIEPPEAHLAGPLAVHLEIIGACNLTCKHCFAGELPRNQNPLQLGEMDTLFDELASIGSFRLGITGGEPLMRRDLFDILDSATDRGLHPCLTTNGLLIDKQIARQLGQRELIWLNVSLDGATAATNDRIRGEGTFDRVIAKLETLREYARFTVAFTLTSLNVDEAQACAQLAKDVGAHTAVFRPLYPVGTAAANLELMPEFADYVGALKSLSDIELGNDIHAIDPFSPQARESTRSKVVLNNGCGAANSIASISVQGDVNPCSFLGPTFDAANIRDRSFENIWNESNRFVEIRQWSQGSACGACGDDPSQDNAFAGGCRARAQVMAGDANVRDPWHTQWATAQTLADDRETGTGRPEFHPLVNIEVQLDK